MKKAIKVLGIACIIAILAIAVSGCGKLSKVKTAFKSAGYEITAVAVDDSADLKSLLKTEEQKADIDKYEVFTFKHFERTATVIKFPDEEVMKEVLGESTYKTKSEGGYINGDCYLVKACTDALYVFKNA